MNMPQIRIVYTQPSLNLELHERRRFVDTFVGEPVDLEFTASSSRKFTLVRMPEPQEKHQKPGQLTGNRLVARLPGLYVIGVEAEGWHREIDVAVFPRTVLDMLEYPATMPGERRTRLRAILADTAVTRATVAAALENGPFTFARLLGRNENAGISMKAYA